MQVAAIFAALGQPAQAVLGDPGSRKAHAVFKHAGEANEAFKRLPGRWELDSCGRRMKVAELPMGEGEAGADGDGDGGVKKPVRTVRVRLMAGHNGLAFWQPSKGKGHQPQDSAPAPAAEDGTPTAAAPAASLAAAATTTRGPAAVVGRKRQAERRAGNDAAGGKKRGKKG